ncbi:NAD-binding protein, partial [Metabacillus fastidiosus]
DKQHVIIIGWNEKASEIIQSVRQIEPFKKIVLVDHTLEEAPLIENVHFIRGNPINDQTLLRANLTEADAAIITADQHKNELEADMQSILILLALKGLNKELYSVIEILTEHQINNAERAGADEIIKSYQLTSHFIISSYLARNKLSSIYADLNPASGNLFQLLNVPVQLIGVTFKKASHELLEKETILIGIKRGEKTIMNPPLSMIIETDDLLIIFAH